MDELEQAGVTDKPEVVVADAQYWNEQHIDHVVAEHGIQVLIPPDSGKRQGERPGWTGGRYSFMRRVLATDPAKSSTANDSNRSSRSSVTPNTTARSTDSITAADRSPHRVAANDGHPQPHQAPPPPDRNRRRLTGHAAGRSNPVPKFRRVEPLLAPKALRDSHARLGGLRAQRLEVARGSQSGSRPAAASSPSETLVFRIAGRNQQCRAPVSADAGSPEGANRRGAVRVLLCRKGAVLVLAEPEARRPIGRETCDAVSAVQRGQRGDYGHVVGVPALVVFCGVGRLPPHRRRQ